MNASSSGGGAGGLLGGSLSGGGLSGGSEGSGGSLGAGGGAVVVVVVVAAGGGTITGVVVVDVVVLVGGTVEVAVVVVIAGVVVVLVVAGIVLVLVDDGGGTSVVVLVVVVGGGSTVVVGGSIVVVGGGSTVVVGWDTPHISTPGPGCSPGGANGPATTTERPCASGNSSPMETVSLPVCALIEFSSTPIGFCPVWSTSSTPGVPTNLQTYQLFASGSAPAGTTASPNMSATETRVAASKSFFTLYLLRLAVEHSAHPATWTDRDTLDLLGR